MISLIRVVGIEPTHSGIKNRCLTSWLYLNCLKITKIMTKFANYKDFALRKKLKSNQNKIFILKSFVLKEEIPKKIRFKIMLKLQQLHKHLLGNKFKNRCMFSTKIRAVSRVSNLTKASFKDNLK